MNFSLCPKQGNTIEGSVANRAGILGFFFVLTRVRVFQWLTYTQILVGYHGPLGPLSYRLY